MLTKIQTHQISDELQINYLEQELEKYLDQNPQDEDVWILYALFEAEMPLKDTPRGAEILKRLLTINPNNINALSILADLQNLDLGGVDQKTFELLSNAKTCCKTDQALLQLLKSFYYSAQDDVTNQKKYLQESIDLDPSLVKPYIDLGKIYLLENNKTEGCKLIAMGLKNIIKSIEPKDRIEAYVNQFIKGVTISQSYINFLKQTTGCDL